jgi:hypothetical protein
MASGWPGKGHGALLKNPSTPLPSTLQGLKKPRHCTVLALMSKCLDAVLDYRLIL